MELRDPWPLAAPEPAAIFPTVCAAAGDGGAKLMKTAGGGEGEARLLEGNTFYFITTAKTTSTSESRMQTKTLY